MVDSGHYVCRLANAEGEVKSRSEATLSVAGKLYVDLVTVFS